MEALSMMEVESMTEEVAGLARLRARELGFQFQLRRQARRAIVWWFGIEPEGFSRLGAPELSCQGSAWLESPAEGASPCMAIVAGLSDIVDTTRNGWKVRPKTSRLLIFQVGGPDEKDRWVGASGGLPLWSCCRLPC